MKKKIAVVCALPPERNVGMATVDLSASQVLPELLPDHNVALYTLGKPGRYSFPRGELPFGYTDIRDDPAAFLSSDAFVFWGDFIHARAYWENDHGWDQATPEQLLQLRAEVSRYFFLSGLPKERLGTAVAFGGTIITNSAGDSLEPAYRQNFERLLAHAGGVFFRDALSAAKGSPYRGLAASLGCDCALLLEDRHLDTIPGFEMPRERKGVGVFFGRSPSRLKMLGFSALVAQALGENRSWIHWFKSYRKMRLMGRAFGYDIGPEQPSTGALLTQLAGYRYIVTDTYHVCVNAWRLGIPALCIGSGAAVSKHSLSDKKKEILFEMYGARDYYVFLEQLALGNMADVARRGAAALADDELAAQVIENISLHRTTARERLAATLETVLAEASVSAPTRFTLERAS